MHYECISNLLLKINLFHSYYSYGVQRCMHAKLALIRYSTPCLRITLLGLYWDTGNYFEAQETLLPRFLYTARYNYISISLFPTWARGVKGCSEDTALVNISSLQLNSFMFLSKVSISSQDGRNQRHAASVLYNSQQAKCI